MRSVNRSDERADGQFAVTSGHGDLATQVRGETTWPKMSASSTGGPWVQTIVMNAAISSIVDAGVQRPCRRRNDFQIAGCAGSAPPSAVPVAQVESDPCAANEVTVIHAEWVEDRAS